MDKKDSAKFIVGVAPTCKLSAMAPPPAASKKEWEQGRRPERALGWHRWA